MGIQNCVHRLQNYSVSLEMIEGTVLCPQDFGVSFFQFFVFKFKIGLNHFLFFCLIALK